MLCASSNITIAFYILIFKRIRIYGLRIDE